MNLFKGIGCIQSEMDQYCLSLGLWKTVQIFHREPRKFLKAPGRLLFDSKKKLIFLRLN